MPRGEDPKATHAARTYATAGHDGIPLPQLTADRFSQVASRRRPTHRTTPSALSSRSARAIVERLTAGRARSRSAYRNSLGSRAGRRGAVRRGAPPDGRHATSDSPCRVASSGETGTADHLGRLRGAEARPDQGASLPTGRRPHGRPGRDPKGGSAHCCGASGTALSSRC